MGLSGLAVDGIESGAVVFPNAIEEHLGGQDQVRLVGLAAFGLWAYGRRRRNGLPELHPLVISAQSEWELTQVLMQQVPARIDGRQYYLPDVDRIGRPTAVCWFTIELGYGSNGPSNLGIEEKVCRQRYGYRCLPVGLSS